MTSDLSRENVERSPAHEALMKYQQADMDGIMVLVSRQAIHEVDDEIRALRDALDKAEADCDELQRLVNRKTFTIEVSGSAEFEQVKRELDEARARVAAVVEEAAGFCQVLERFPQLQAIGSTIHDDLADDIRALALDTERDALEAVKERVVSVALDVCGYDWDALGDDDKARLRAALSQDNRLPNQGAGDQADDAE